MTKRLFLLSIIVLGLSYSQVQAQQLDTIEEGDPMYLFYQPKPVGLGIGCTSWNFTGCLVQEYWVKDSITVYGVAVTFDRRDSDMGFQNFYDYKAVLMEPQGYNIDTNHLALQHIDSVRINNGLVVSRKFRYVTDNYELVVPCYEFYFPQPHLVTDSFYVGRVHMGNQRGICEYGVTYSYSDPGSQYYTFSDIDSFALEHFCLFGPDSRHWGVFFPIVGLRCNPVSHYELTDLSTDSVVVSWNNVEDSAAYRLRLMGDDGSDTSFTTRDTSLTLRGLSADVRYNVMLCRQCQYSTLAYDSVNGYDTLVYSQWLSGLAFRNGAIDTASSGGIDTTGTGGIDTTGTGGNPTEEIMRANGDSFSLTPNPARSSVLVTLPAAAVGGRLSLCDLAGRELEAHTVQGPSLELDVSTRAAGVYLVKLVTPRGVSSRRLVVE